MFKSYSFGEFLFLVYAMIVDAIFNKIPKQTFTVKNTYDALIARNAEFVRREKEVLVSMDNLRFRLRLKGSDFRVFNQIVLGGGMARAIELLRSLNIDKPKVMDCGSNIGLCTLLLKEAFPGAEIIAVEPAQNNFEQLKKNVHENGFDDIRLVNGGVWYETSTLAIKSDFRDGSDWAVALEKSKNENLNTVGVNTPQQIAFDNNWQNIDYLKIDIEGSEFALFEHLQNWQGIFNTIKLISIEPHEEVGEVVQLVDILKLNGFSVQLYQELIIGIRNER